jgi:hypothetical protein
MVARPQGSGGYAVLTSPPHETPVTTSQPR